ncbi:MAG TPA: HEXXH motif-containing putative peptide modification protein [Polyangiaceae bacterium]
MPAPPTLPSPRDLTVPEAGSTTARDVLSRAIGRVLRELRPLLRLHAASAPDDVAAMEQALAMVDVAPLASVLRRPHAAALVRSLRTTPRGEGGALLTELLATLAFDLDRLGALAAPVTLRRQPPRLVSLVAREVVTPATGAVDRPYHVVERETVLALADNNPLAMHEAHPDKEGNAVDLGGHPVEEWLGALRDAFAVVAEHLPELREEMALYAQAIVPVGYFAEKHLSASYREAIGTLYLSLHPSPMTMVEALVHETQHSKMNALLELDDVLENAHEPLYRSPVRPDARPLHGVLLAVHAFVPVARLYERMLAAGDPRARGSEARFRDVARINREGTAVLREHARPTPVGQGVMDELLRWDAHFAGA